MANLTYIVSATWLQMDQDILSIEIDRRVGDVFEAPQVGRCTITLDNARGDYAPSANADLNIDKSVSVTVQDSSGTNHSLFTGTVDRINQNPEPGHEMAVVEASDQLRKLRRNLNISLKTDIGISSLMTDILSHALISPRSVDIIRDTAPYSLVDDVSGGEMIRRVIEAGKHFAFVSGDGTFRFVDRNFDIGQSATNSFERFLGYEYTLNDERLMNDVRISSQPREATTNVQTIAWLIDNPTIAASDSITFFLEFIDPNNREARTPANSVATPVNSTDYTMNTQEDGTGTDLTNTTSASVDIFAQTAKVTVFNGSGQEGFLTKMKMRGFPLRRVNRFTEQTEVDSSQTEFGRESFKINNDLIPDRNYASNYSQYMASRWHDPLPDLTATLKNDEPAIFNNEVLDRIHVVNSVTGVKSDHLIISVNHRITFDNAGREHQVDYGLRLSDDKNFLILDKDPEGKLDVRELGF